MQPCRHPARQSEHRVLPSLIPCDARDERPDGAQATAEYGGETFVAGHLRSGRHCCVPGGGQHPPLSENDFSPVPAKTRELRVTVYSELEPAAPRIRPRTIQIARLIALRRGAFRAMFTPHQE